MEALTEMVPFQSQDSRQAGVLQPDPPSPGRPGWFDPERVEGQRLEDFLQQYVAATAGLEGTMVRPRWQPEPPTLPDFHETWAAVGIQRHRQIGVWSATLHHGEGDGQDVQWRWEELDILISFYGPLAAEVASDFHGNQLVWQNHSILRQVGVAFVANGDAVFIPEFIKNQWVQRVDKGLVWRREIRRVYPVLNLMGFYGRVRFDISRYRAPFGYPKENDNANVPEEK